LQRVSARFSREVQPAA